MSLLDSIKKGLMGEGDEYEDQYIDDGPQMVNNNNSGVGIGMDEETEEPAEGTSKKNKVVNIHATTQLKVVLVKPERFEDQYIDDGPQMVNNNNSGVGIGMDEETEEPAEGTSKKNKVVNIHATTQLKVVLVKPERFEDASTIADHLNNKRTVVLNLESTNKEVSRRLVDFLSGVAYANNGQIKRVANSTFIITPYNVDIMGDLLDELENNGAFY